MRVEKNSDIKEELAKTQTALSSEIKRGAKTGHPILTCLLIAILLLILVVGWIGSVVAKTGLVEVPGLTKIFYTKPEPTRLVQADQLLEQVISEELTGLINQRIRQVDGVDIDRSITLELSEETLTASLRQFLAGQNKYLIVSEAQIAAWPPNQLETFLPLAKNELNSALSIRLQLAINQDQRLDLTIQSLEIGCLRLPVWLISRLLDKPLNLILDQLNDNVAQYATWEEVEVRGQSLLLTGQLSVNILEL